MHQKLMEASPWKSLETTQRAKASQKKERDPLQTRWYARMYVDVWKHAAQSWFMHKPSMFCKWVDPAATAKLTSNSSTPAGTCKDKAYHRLQTFPYTQNIQGARQIVQGATRCCSAALCSYAVAQGDLATLTQQPIIL